MESGGTSDTRPLLVETLVGDLTGTEGFLTLQVEAHAPKPGSFDLALQGVVQAVGSQFSLDRSLNILRLKLGDDAQRATLDLGDTLVLPDTYPCEHQDARSSRRCFHFYDSRRRRMRSVRCSLECLLGALREECMRPDGVPQARLPPFGGSQRHSHSRQQAAEAEPGLFLGLVSTPLRLIKPALLALHLQASRHRSRTTVAELAKIALPARRPLQEQDLHRGARCVERTSTPRAGRSSPSLRPGRRTGGPLQQNCPRRSISRPRRMHAQDATSLQRQRSISYGTVPVIGMWMGARLDLLERARLEHQEYPGFWLRGLVPLEWTYQYCMTEVQAELHFERVPTEQSDPAPRRSSNWHGWLGGAEQYGPPHATLRVGVRGRWRRP